jgi:hypothetical protein
LSKSSRFYFPSTDREERFGKLMFAVGWEGPQTDRELELLARFYDPGPTWVEFGDDGPYAASPLENWVYPGGSGDAPEASAARARALKRRHQLMEVQEALRLIDKYGHQSSGPEDFERLDLGDDREKLREARRIIAGYSQANVKPKTPSPENVLTTVRDAETRKHDGSRANNRAEQDCKQWLINCAADHSEKHPNGTKKKVAAVAMKRFGGLSRRGFERAWREVVRDYGANWDDPGRPKMEQEQELLRGDTNHEKHAGRARTRNGAIANSAVPIKIAATGMAL